MHRHVTLSLIAVALGSLTASEAFAQDRLDISGLEISPHGGVIFLNEFETTEFFAGATGLFHLGGGLALGATADWVGTKVEVGDDDLDATIWYYSGEIWYGLPSVSRAQFYGAIGGGVAQFQPGTELEDAGAEDESDLLIPIELGVRWVNDKADPDWGAMFQFRSRVVYSDEEDDTEVTNDWSLGMGLSLLIGG